MFVDLIQNSSLQRHLTCGHFDFHLGRYGHVLFPETVSQPALTLAQKLLAVTPPTFLFFFFITLKPRVE